MAEQVFLWTGGGLVNINADKMYKAQYRGEKKNRFNFSYLAIKHEF